MAYTIYDGFNIQFGTIGGTDSVPVDYRIVADDASQRTSILYKYDGLKVFQRDNRLSYIWNSSTSNWDLDTSGVSATGSTNYVVKITGSTATGLVLGNSALFNNGTLVGLNTIDPKEVFQINGGASQPLVFHKGGSTIIGYNWYYNSGDNYFNNTKGSAQIVFSDAGDLNFKNRPSNGVFNTSSVYISNDGKVGINTVSPTYSLQTTGDIGLAGSLWFTNISNTRIHSDGFTLYFKVANTNMLQLTDDGYVYLTGGNGMFLSGNGDGVSIDSTTSVNIQKITSGVTNIGGVIRIANGSVSAPILSFSASNTTGIYSPATGQIGFSTGGTNRMTIVNSAVIFNIASLGATTRSAMITSQGNNVYSSASSPDYTWYNNSTCGMYHPGLNEISFSTNSIQRMTITNSSVKINTFLEITGGSGYTLPSTYLWFSSSEVNGVDLIRGSISPIPSTGSRTLSIYATGDVRSTLFVAASDERIKDIVSVSDNNSDLEKIKNIKVTDYRYKDFVKNGNSIHKKLIAQNIKEVLPSAVTESIDFIPNIYSLTKSLKINDGFVRIELLDVSDLSNGDLLKISDEKENICISEIFDIDYKNNTLSLKIDDSLIVKDKLFVYGKRINDFLLVDYESVFSLNLSATQKLIKLVDELSDKIKKIEGKI